MPLASQMMQRQAPEVAPQNLDYEQVEQAVHLLLAEYNRLSPENPEQSVLAHELATQVQQRAEIQEQLLKLVSELEQMRGVN